MGFMLLMKKMTVVFLLISASFLSISCLAGRRITNKLARDIADVTINSEETSGEVEETTVHERVLRVKTNDYGNYNPTPSLVRPPFKLIPN